MGGRVKEAAASALVALGDVLVAWSIVVVLALAFGAGCSAAQAVTDEAGRYEVREYEGRVWGFEVEVRQVRREGMCVSRRVRLRLPAGINMRPEVPEYVTAYDLECNDRFDQVMVRDPRDWEKVRAATLHEFLLFAMYAVLPVPEQARYRI